MVSTHRLHPSSIWTNNEDVTWENLAERAHYSAQRLSCLVGVSVRTLQRHFAKNYRITVGEFLSKLRMSEAVKRLRSGQSVKAVCYDLGFKQVSHFSRVFKEFYGAPPSLWLRSPLDGLSFRDEVGHSSNRDPEVTGVITN